MGEAGDIPSEKKQPCKRKGMNLEHDLFLYLCQMRHEKKEETQQGKDSTTSQCFNALHCSSSQLGP